MNASLAQPRYGKAKRAAQIGVTATTFLALSIAFGPRAAFWLIGITALIACWAWLCVRFPFFGVFTVACLSGFISGLFGWRGGYYYRPYYRRRRR